ncbi:spore maturation protein CgeB [Desulfobaculum xiamenense]|uniref:Spore maturation protein CgeB n=1 Tax=Desulfobaculum xiamenense TaxID=995050 RepID=A0A846QET7_9BACT|nr:glycosyltransferase [Desulfobaculum xiamenense]NJB66781.1 spore maturation protein CgeB [Desulfobaculum xiamenense]
MTSKDTSVRVLLVLPMYGGSLPVGRYCARALTRLGHVVETFEAPEFHQSFEALRRMRVSRERLQYLENSFLNVISQAIMAKVEAFCPDLVLCLAQAPMSIQTLKRLRRDGVATAMWFVEDYRLFTYWMAFAPHYDFFAIIQEDPFFDELEAVGQSNALYLPLAADPEFHCPMDLSSVDRRMWGSDLSFMGAGYPNRRVAFRRLVNRDFKIWGTEWDGDPALEALVQMNGRRLSSEECVKIFNATRINLNLHSSVDSTSLVSNGDFVNPRTFELAACGAFQLVDERALMADLFWSDELATFRSIPEMEEMIDHFLAHPEEREEYARRGRERVLADHTYDRRMQTLLDFVAARREGWPARRGGEEFFAEYPPELRDKVLALLDRLGLPAQTSFDDLVWTLRQQQGTLSDVETAILFLDEWRKQYGGKRA